MSKTYSLPGLRVGWVAAREDLINEINHQRQYNTISISFLDDYFSAYALENRDFIHDRNYMIMKYGIGTLNHWVSNEPLVDCIIPKGGTTALLKYDKEMLSRELCKKLMKETGVALLPGETLEMEGYLRVGFCADNLSQALLLVSQFLHSI